MDFLGLNATQPVAVGAPRRRIYFDAAATCLMPSEVFATVQRYLATSCANPHSHASAVSRATTVAMRKVHQWVGEFFGADPASDVVIFTGSGATGPTNLLARAFSTRGVRDIVVYSEMEHHSNLLPWRRSQPYAKEIPALPDGSPDLDFLRHFLAQYGSRVRVVTLTALSNVTGLITPIQTVAQMVHATGAELVIDAAQAAGHIPLNMSLLGIDYLVASGHKMYAPGAPGVLIAKRALLAQAEGDVGGGTVDRVDDQGAWFKDDLSERFEAGTPNIPGTIALGAAVRLLRRETMDRIRLHEIELLREMQNGLVTIQELVQYGPLDVNFRGGLIAFNVGSMPHGLVAAALNDYFAIAVRNDCFCAQPYVRQQLDAKCEIDGYCAPNQFAKRGMVRASIGLWNTKTDVAKLIVALKWIAEHKEFLLGEYNEVGDDWVHKTFKPTLVFSLDGA